MSNHTAAYLDACDRARGADNARLLELLREAYEELYDARETLRDAEDDVAESEGKAREAEEELEDTQKERDRAIEKCEEYERLANAIENKETEALWTELRKKIAALETDADRRDREIADSRRQLAVAIDQRNEYGEELMRLRRLVDAVGPKSAVDTIVALQTENKTIYEQLNSYARLLRGFACEVLNGGRGSKGRLQRLAQEARAIEPATPPGRAS